VKSVVNSGFMKHEALTGQIIGAAMAVLNELKPGLDEKLRPGGRAALELQRIEADMETRRGSATKVNVGRETTDGTDWERNELPGFRRLNPLIKSGRKNRQRTAPGA
jgi:hypothetical protein